jgi:hypothetical protein
MDQLSVVTDVLISHGLSVTEAAETAASIVSALQASASNQATEVIDTIFDKAMSFWLITSSSR